MNPEYLLHCRFQSKKVITSPNIKAIRAKEEGTNAKDFTDRICIVNPFNDVCK
jgi:hypothetical protein